MASSAQLLQALETSRAAEVQLAQDTREIRDKTDQLGKAAQESSPLLAQYSNTVDQLQTRSARLEAELQETKRLHGETVKKVDALERDYIGRLSLIAKNSIRDCRSCAKSLCYQFLFVSICTSGGVGIAMLRTHSTAVLLLAGVGGATVSITCLIVYRKVRNLCKSSAESNGVDASSKV